METSVLGGGLLLAIAAALWLVYLVPNWLRRREYLATERNAVRLQQTIRVLAETAETPEAVRVENAARARALARELRDRPVAVGAPVTTPLPAGLDPRARATARLRRTRLAVSTVVLVAVTVVAVQVGVGISAGLAAVSPMLAVGGMLLALTGVALLGRLARIGRARSAATVAAQPARRSVVVPDIAVAAAEPVRRREWTPRPLPRPTYLDRPAAPAPTAADVARAAARAEAELSEAADAAARAIRRAQEQVPAATRAPAAGTDARPASTPSRFASMGVVDAAAVPAMPDIDGALRRRRAG